MLFLKTINKLVVWSIAIKEDAKIMFWSKKNGSNLKNISDFSENSKVSYGRFKRNGLHERYWYISKSRWDVQYLEVY